MPEIHPSKLATAVDSYRELRELRLAEQKKVDKLRAEENGLKLAIIEAMQKHDMTAIGGATHTVTRVFKNEPTVEDWAALQEHILKTGELDLIQRRLSPVAVRTRWDTDVEVPGVVRMPTESLSMTKNRGT